MAAAFECDRCGKLYKSNQVEMKSESGSTYYRTVHITVECANERDATVTKTLDLCPHCQDVVYRCVGTFERRQTT